jgi:hypothetical protein
MGRESSQPVEVEPKTTRSCGNSAQEVDVWRSAVSNSRSIRFLPTGTPRDEREGFRAHDDRVCAPRRCRRRAEHRPVPAATRGASSKAMSQRLRWYASAVAMLPLVLVASVGALGLALGPAAAALNLAIMGPSLPRAVRIGVAVVIGAAAALLWSWLVVTLPKGLAHRVRPLFKRAYAGGTVAVEMDLGRCSSAVCDEPTSVPTQ